MPMQKSARSNSKKSGSTTAKKGNAGGTKKRTSGASGRSAASSNTTTDHDQIRRWAEERGGQPASVIGTGGENDTGLLRIDFPGFSGEGKLEPISWEDFFDKFDEQSLALLYQEQTAAGEPSNFNKLVSRETADAKSPKSSSRSGSKSSSKKTTAKRSTSAPRGRTTAKKAPPSKAKHGRGSK